MELHDALQELHVVATAPEFYSIMIDLNTVSSLIGLLVNVVCVRTVSLVVKYNVHIAVVVVTVVVVTYILLPYRHTKTPTWPSRR